MQQSSLIKFGYSIFSSFPWAITLIFYLVLLQETTRVSQKIAVTKWNCISFNILNEKDKFKANLKTVPTIQVVAIAMLINIQNIQVCGFKKTGHCIQSGPYIRRFVKKGFLYSHSVNISGSFTRRP